MTLGSLFSGIGGLDLGLERAGFEVKWQIENNPYCQGILAKHWPDVKRYGDITTVTGDELTPVDMICGGFPCQPVSVAGQRQGVNDDKGRWLWPEFKRLVGVLRPRLVFVENVTGLLTANDGHAFGEILGDLAQLRFNAEWQMLRASDLGAPHIRERIFIIGTNQDVADTKRDTEGRTHGSTRGGGDQGREGACLSEWDTMGRNTSDRHLSGSWAWSDQSKICAVAYGVSERVAQLTALGNAVVPQCAEYIGRLILNGTIAGGR